MQMIPRSLLAAAAVSLFAAGGCARRSDDPRPLDPPTFAEVDNQAYLDATVYVLRSTQRIRLGHAPGGRRSIFRIPRDVMFGPTYLQFQIDFVGSSRSPRSEQINVSPGDTVTLLIPPG
jgi:hypothetical protein